MAPYRIDDAFLSPAERVTLLDWTLDNEARFTAAALGGGQVDPAVRQASSLRDLGTMGPVFRQRILDAVPDLIRELRVTGFAPSDIELELVAHGDGAHFVFHADTYTGSATGQRGDRMLSAVYYFHREPREFSGGQLRMHRFGAQEGDDGFIDIEPLQNRLVVFPSWAPHEVRAVSVPSRAFAASRFAVNCWVYRAITPKPLS